MNHKTIEISGAITAFLPIWQICERTLLRTYDVLASNYVLRQTGFFSWWNTAYLNKSTPIRWIESVPTTFLQMLHL